MQEDEKDGDSDLFGRVDQKTGCILPNELICTANRENFKYVSLAKKRNAGQISVIAVSY